jgi:saccharopine dehydrogenase-like NADP-dependent oxidoreductase
MRIMVLGGVGWIGSIITRILAEHPETTEVVIGDVDLEGAVGLIGAIGGDKLSVERVDVTDHEGLVAVMGGFDCIANATWYEMAMRVTRASLEAGVDVVDLGGMPGLTREQLDLHGRAVEAGVLNVIGIGETPGISNLFARWGADRLDTVEAIRIRDGEYGKDSLDWLQHSVRTSMDEMTEPSVMYEGGRYVTKPPRSGREMYRFPEPIGEQECFYVPFEEAFTLPAYLGKPVDNVEMRVTVSPTLMAHFDVLEMFGLTSAKPVTTRAGVTVPPVDVLISSVLHMEIPPRAGRTYSCIAVELDGTLEGKPVRRRITGMMEDRPDWGVDGEGYKTALPLALAAVMVARGEIPRRGVFPPEACIDPEPFVRLLELGGLRVTDELEPR